MREGGCSWALVALLSITSACSREDASVASAAPVTSATPSASSAAPSSSTGPCTPAECGPTPGAPLKTCPDGSQSGFVGCTRGANGRCGWEWRECPPSSAPGSLVVQTFPKDAQVMLDGKVVCPDTPCWLRDVSTGKHTVVVTHAKKGTVTREIVVRAATREAVFVDYDHPPPPAR